MARSQVIVLNGVGSVGKSSTARALQAVAVRPFLHVAMDAFIQMMPMKLVGHPDGLSFERSVEDRFPLVTIVTGPVLERTLLGMRHAIAALADAGNDLVVDEVMLGNQHRDYRRLLAHHDLRIVGLFAPLDVLEERERRRGDREPGLSRWQYGRVHNGVDYDLTLDTAEATPSETAMRICAAFGLETST